jgi:UDP-N-acetylmuramyl-tripeptide synthetase
MRVIAVTGTNGKTTTAAYINEILKSSGIKTAMFGTAVIELAGERKINDTNTTVSTTGAMQRFFRDAKKAGVGVIVLEVTSQALQQHKLDSVPIEAAVMTNLTQDHLDYHKTMERYAEAKSRLFRTKPRFIVLNRDDEWYDYFSQFKGEEQTMTYGTSDEAECRIATVKLHKEGSEVELEIDHQTHLSLATRLPGKFNVYNLSAAVTVAYLLHVDLEAIEEGILNLHGVPGRQERVDVKKPYDVIVDYAHTPDAMEQLLETMKHLTKNRVILVFGATGDRDKTKRPIMGDIAARLADRIFVTDEESYNEDPAQIRAQVLDGIKRSHGEAKTEEVADRKRAIERALGIARPGDSVVITGMGHEQFRIIDGERLPWNDAEVVKEILA